MAYVIRPVKAQEWQRLRELRMAALADPVARVAFNETLEEAAGQPDELWQSRAARSEEGVAPMTFIGEASDGSWGGMVVVLVETDEEVPQTHLVGVYVRPEHRGTGLARELFRAAIGWSWGLAKPAVERVRLWVHEENGRAEAFYRALGFVETGLTSADPKDPAALERELVLKRGDRV
ncbi:ribosomal protein S18 acetylase RimI-like enzyme [Streptomyces sp. 2333.5]|uniref:GNAT family N-acetyltransferase n=1 Tax=unclassified Streptomyces TaxID=2593676 RepID=UPI00089CC253|nr:MULTISPECIES: GNAT family N-acetyltransferase [unclassified Streptomyces]PJJ03637.1 ribosomal protein S18 acetylase RimI-like enzyme [Streptomyces sp. 2333.5]SEE25299.1 Ribosomal protein S18 acetylase RimI [Streptomyces sp. 2314.4]SEE53358.1 Ribosomal protein S18 acetylase RimI [Streptomyces sp. 2112.2]